MTWGQDFFRRHLESLASGDIEGMVRDTCTPDAILLNAFPIFEEAPPNIIRGHDTLISAFQATMDWQGRIESISPDNVLEDPGVISFQASFSTANTGAWVAGDCWLLRDGRIHQHIGFAHQLSPPQRREVGRNQRRAAGSSPTVRPLRWLTERSRGARARVDA